MLTKVRTHPAPDPLPSTWARAVANSITSEFRTTGWRKYKLSRAHHPTGNPRTGSDRITSGVQRTPLLSNTELIEEGFHLTGTVDPIPTLNVPALAWRINQLTAVGALADRPDLHEPLNTLCKRTRRDTPFTTRDNRHGNPSIRPNLTTTSEEREAITLIAAAAQIVIVDELDYWDWLTQDFNAQAVLQLLEEAP